MLVKTFWMFNPLQWNTGNTEMSKNINNCPRGSHPENFKIAVLKNSRKFSGKHIRDGVFCFNFSLK